MPAERRIPLLPCPKAATHGGRSPAPAPGDSPRLGRKGRPRASGGDPEPSAGALRRPSAAGGCTNALAGGNRMRTNRPCSDPLIKAKAHLLLGLIELSRMLSRCNLPNHLLKQLHDLQATLPFEPLQIGRAHV